MVATPEINQVRLPLTALDVPHMMAALARWQAAAVGRRMPSEALASPFDLDAALGYLGIIDVLRNPSDFKFRYFGKKMAAAQGEDYTGRRFSELEPSVYGSVVRRGYDEVCRERTPVLHHIRFLDQARARNYFRLLLPLSEGGVEVDVIWAVTHYYQGTWQPYRR
ncbi:MAG TPA: PAS domain-containing protein [Stellaceae bacterium]|nr:PAS domain-containing protein [Stellaceae bacterium]